MFFKKFTKMLSASVSLDIDGKLSVFVREVKKKKMV